MTNLAVTSSTAWWYLSRASGLVSLLLLTASMVLGVVTTVRWSSERWPRFAINFVHRNVSLIAVVFIVVHVASVVIDGFAPIGWLDTMVPFISNYRPIWLGLGALAFDLVIALVVTSLLRNRIGQRTWRFVHWLAYLCWPIALVHGLATGTDPKALPVQVVNATCIALVVVAVWWRATAGWPAHRGARIAALTASVAAPLLLGVWVVDGPLATGWAERAGTPAALLGASSTNVDASTDTSSSSNGGNGGASVTNGTVDQSFAAAFSGSARQSAPNATGAVTLEFSAQLSQGAEGTLTIDLHGQPSSAGRLAIDSGTVTIVSPFGRTTYSGQLTQIQGNTLYFAPNTGSGSTTALAVDIGTLNISAGTVNGTVQAVAGGADRR